MAYITAADRKSVAGQCILLFNCTAHSPYNPCKTARLCLKTRTAFVS